SDLDEEQTGRLIAALRESRGLGDRRFAALLERNARLRRLAEERVRVSPEDVELAYRIRYGPRFRARVLLVRTERRAAEIRAELAAAEAGLPGRFAEAAARWSVDPSGPRGGVVEPISPLDPAYPAAVRRLLPTMEVGQLSPVIAV